MKGHIRERSPGHWAIILDIIKDGTRKRKWHSFKGTKREAQAECARLVTTMKDGAYVEANKLTVGQYLLERLAQWETGKKVGPRTAERYRELINDQIIPHLGNKQLQKLKAIDIDNWHNTLIANGRKDGKGGLSNRTIGHAHRILSKGLKEAARFDLIVKNVASTENPPKVEGGEVQIVGADRLKELLARLDGHPLYPKAALALFAGLRRGEVMGLRWRHVDLEVRDALEETRANGIRVKPPKSRAGRRDIVMPDILIDALRAHRQAQLELRLRLGLGKLSGDDLLFPNIDGGLTSPQQLSSQWFVFAKSIGMGDVTFHALRRTHVAQLIDAGVDVMMIAKRLGHARASTTLNHYGHLFRSTDDKAAAAINSAVKGW